MYYKTLLLIIYVSNIIVLYSLAPSHQIRSLNSLLEKVPQRTQEQSLSVTPSEGETHAFFCTQSSSPTFMAKVHKHPQSFNRLSLEKACHSLNERTLIESLREQLPQVFKWLKDQNYKPTPISSSDIFLIQDANTGNIVSCSINERVLSKGTGTSKESWDDYMVKVYVNAIVHSNSFESVLKVNARGLQTDLSPQEIENLKAAISTHLIFLSSNDTLSILAIIHDPILRKYLHSRNVPVNKVNLLSQNENGTLEDANLKDTHPIKLSIQDFNWLREIQRASSPSRQKLPSTVQHACIDFTRTCVTHQVGQSYKKSLNATTVKSENQTNLVVVHQPKRTSLAEFMQSDFHKLNEHQQTDIFNQMIATFEALHKNYPNVFFQDISLQDFAIIPIGLEKSFVTHAIKFQALEKMLPLQSQNQQQREQQFINSILQFLWQATVVNQPPQSFLRQISDTIQSPDPSQTINHLKALTPHVILPYLENEMQEKQSPKAGINPMRSFYHLCRYLQKTTCSMQQVFQACHVSHSGKYFPTVTKSECESIWKKSQCKDLPKKTSEFLKNKKMQKELKAAALNGSPQNVTKFLFLASSLPDDIKLRGQIDLATQTLSTMEQYCIKLCAIYLGVPSANRKQLEEELSWLQEQVNIHQLEYSQNTLDWLRITEMLHVKYYPNTRDPMIEKVFAKAIKVNVPFVIKTGLKLPKLDLNSPPSPYLISEEGSFSTIIVPQEWYLQFGTPHEFKNPHLVILKILLVTNQEVSPQNLMSTLRKAVDDIPPQLTNLLHAPATIRVEQLYKFKLQIQSLQDKFPRGELKEHLQELETIVTLLNSRLLPHVIAKVTSQLQNPQESDIIVTPQNISIILLQQFIQNTSPESLQSMEYEKLIAISELAQQFPHLTIPQMLSSQCIHPNTYLQLEAQPNLNQPNVSPKLKRYLFEKVVPVKDIPFLQKQISLVQSHHSPTTEKGFLQEELIESTIVLQIHTIIHALISQPTSITPSMIDIAINLQTALVILRESNDFKAVQRIVAQITVPEQADWKPILDNVKHDLELGPLSQRGIETSTEQCLSHLSELRPWNPQNAQLTQHNHSLQNQTQFQIQARQIGLTMQNALKHLKSQFPKAKVISPPSAKPYPNITQTIADSIHIYISTILSSPQGYIPNTMVRILEQIDGGVQRSCNVPNQPPPSTLARILIIQLQNLKMIDGPIKQLIKDLSVILHAYNNISSTLTVLTTPTDQIIQALQSIASTISSFQERTTALLQLPPLQEDNIPIQNRRLPEIPPTEVEFRAEIKTPEATTKLPQVENGQGTYYVDPSLFHEETEARAKLPQVENEQGAYYIDPQLFQKEVKDRPSTDTETFQLKEGQKPHYSNIPSSRQTDNEYLTLLNESTEGPSKTMESEATDHGFYTMATSSPLEEDQDMSSTKNLNETIESEATDHGFYTTATSDPLMEQAQTEQTEQIYDSPFEENPYLTIPAERRLQIASTQTVQTAQPAKARTTSQKLAQKTKEKQSQRPTKKTKQLTTVTKKLQGVTSKRMTKDIQRTLNLQAPINQSPQMAPAAFLFGHLMPSPQLSESTEHIKEFEFQCNQILQSQVLSKYSSQGLPPTTVVSNPHHKYIGLVFNEYNAQTESHTIFIHPMVSSVLASMSEEHKTFLLTFLLTNEYDQIVMNHTGQISSTENTPVEDATEIVSMVHTFLGLPNEDIQRSYTILQDFIQNINLELELRTPEGVSLPNLQEKMTTLRQIFELAQKCSTQGIQEPMAIVAQLEQEKNFQQMIESVKILRTFA